MKRSATYLATVVLLCTLVAPANASSPSPTPTNPYGGVKVDPPGPSDTILTISKGKKIVRLSLNALQALKPTEISIYEPFIRARQKFTVVKLSSIFKLVDVNENDRISTVALNDYVFANTAKSFLRADGYLAIKRNGQLIPYDQGGPIRIIYPDSSRWSKYLDSWNWSLTRITAK